MKSVTIVLLLATIIAVAFATSDRGRGRTDTKPYRGKDKYFIPKTCSSFNYNGNCPRNIVQGCACYRDGTCEYRRNGNGCSICQEKEVVSFNAEERCPKLNRQKLNVCTNTGNVKCPKNRLKQQSICECNKNGSCNYVKGSPCQSCNKKGVVSVLQGQCSVLRK